MKKSFVIFLVFLLAGCASATFDRHTGILEYDRFGNQEIEGLNLVYSETLPDGAEIQFKVKVESQRSEREIAEVLIALSKNIDKALQILKELQEKIPGLF